jgi:hypothetical protein
MVGAQPDMKGAKESIPIESAGTSLNFCHWLTPTVQACVINPMTGTGVPTEDTL